MKTMTLDKEIRACPERRLAEPHARRADDDVREALELLEPWTDADHVPALAV